MIDFSSHEALSHLVGTIVCIHLRQKEGILEDGPAVVRGDALQYVRRRTHEVVEVDREQPATLAVHTRPSGSAAVTT